MVVFVLQLTVRINMYFFLFCYLLLFTWIHNTLTKSKCIFMCYSWQDSEIFLNASKITSPMVKRARCQARKQRVAGSFPSGDIHFHFECFTHFPFLQLGWSLANEIKHDHSLVLCSYFCFRLQIPLIIQWNVYLQPQYSFKLSSAYTKSCTPGQYTCMSNASQNIFIIDSDSLQRLTTHCENRPNNVCLHISIYTYIW